MPWWVYSLAGAAGVLAWQLASARRVRMRNSNDRCADCGERLEITRFRFEGNAVCVSCAHSARQDLTWGAWLGFGLAALGALTAIGKFLFDLIFGRHIEIVWIALPAMFGLMFLWFVQWEARSLRQLNQVAARIEELQRLEMLSA